jgi:hypothetical protein
VALISKTNARKILVILAGVILLVALLYLEEDWRGIRAWKNYKHEWEAKGEHFDFASFIPQPVSDDQNFALTPIVASCYGSVLDKNGHRIRPPKTNVVNRLEMSVNCRCKEWPTNHDWRANGWRRGMKTDLAGWQEHYRATAKTNYYCPFATNEFPITAQLQSPAADVLLALSKYDAAIEELRQASRLPYSRFPLNYDTPYPPEILAPQWGAFKSSISVLALRAVAELSNDQNQKALDDIKLMLYLVNSFRDDPRFFAHKSVRIPMLNSAIQPIWEGLAEHKWSDDQLATIEQDLARFDFFADYCHAVRGERAMHSKTIEYFYENRFTNHITCMFGCHILWGSTMVYRLSPKGWFDINELGIARICQQSLPTEDEISRRVMSRTLAKRFGIAYGREDGRRFFPYHFFIGILCDFYGSDAKQFAFAQASVDMARVTCALERYRHANGGYPESLGALTPQFIEKVPHDIINGQPLHYRRTGGGKFLLYSIGWNEKDDGGQVVLKQDGSEDPGKGDWVWKN